MFENAPIHGCEHTGDHISNNQNKLRHHREEICFIFPLNLEHKLKFVRKLYCPFGWGNEGPPLSMETWWAFHRAKSANRNLKKKTFKSFLAQHTF